LFDVCDNFAFLLILLHFYRAFDFFDVPFLFLGLNLYGKNEGHALSDDDHGNGVEEDLFCLFHILLAIPCKDLIVLEVIKYFLEEGSVFSNFGHHPRDDVEQSLECCGVGIDEW
jgi:hypothetical protein